MVVGLSRAVVLEPERSNVATLRWQVLLVALLLSALVTRVWVRCEVTQIGYDLAEEHSVAVTLDMERRELELERSVLMKPDALTARASQQLGLQLGSPAEFYRVRY